jgi:hypothetical protein
MLHDVKVKRKRPTEFVEMMPVPPDELIISDRTRSATLQDADVQHRMHVSLSVLRQMGYKVDDDIQDDDRGETLEEFERQRFGQRGDLYEDETSDPARRIVLFKETYIRIDRDGDGIAELRRVCSVGMNLLADEECDIVPVACFSGIIMPHQHLGLSVYDLIKDIAQIKTSLTRGLLDNTYRAQNGRFGVDVNRVNVDDLLVSRPGGVIRVNGGDPSSAIFPVQHADTSAASLSGLEYMDSVRENRTGYTRQSQGLDTDALVNKTVGATVIQLSQSQLRLELIARTIAETGVRDMFRICHALTLKHATKAEKVRLRNKWVVVNPREWVRRTDLSISVGLGTSTTQQLAQNLMALGQAQQQAAGIGLCTPQNFYNTLKKLPAAFGFKNAEEFFTPPQPGPPGPDGKPTPAQLPQHQDPSIQVAQIKAQADQQVSQAKHQSDQIKLQAQFQLDHAKALAQQQTEIAQMNADMQVERMKAEMKAQTDTMRNRLEAERSLLDTKYQMQLEAFKSEQQQQTAIVIAHINAAAKISSAEVAAKASDGAEQLSYERGQER